MSVTLFRRIVVVVILVAVLGSVALGAYQAIDSGDRVSNLEDWSSELQDDFPFLWNGAKRGWEVAEPLLGITTLVAEAMVTSRLP